MGIFIKTVTKEVVDAASIHFALRKTMDKYPLLSPKVVVRLVMSTKTKEAIKREHAVFNLMPTVSVIKAADYFEGHPVDINDSLEFGEVRFTVEL